MIKVNFYEQVEEHLLKFAVIIAKYQGKYIFCKHHERNTLEIPGGHREIGESMEETAKRELYEESGAVQFELKPICVYSVVDDKCETFGMLYYAEVTSLDNELHNEIEKIILRNKLPNNWTYPLIQPKLIEEAMRRGII